MEHYSGKSPIEQSMPAGDDGGASSSISSPKHGTPNIIEDSTTATTVEDVDESKKGWTAYFRTRDFYIVLVLGYAPIHVILATLAFTDD